MAYEIMNNNKTNTERGNVETAHDKGGTSTELLGAFYLTTLMKYH